MHNPGARADQLDNQGGQFQKSVDEEAEPQVNQDTHVHSIELVACRGRKMRVEREVDPIA